MKQLLMIDPFKYDIEQIIPNNHGLAIKVMEIIEKYNILLDYINLPEAEHIANTEIIENPNNSENMLNTIEEV